MARRPPSTTRTYALFPYTYLFRSRIRGVLRGHIVLDHHVHACPEGGHQADPCRARDAGKLLARMALVHIAQRYPFDVRKAAVDPPGKRVERIVDVLIGCNLVTRHRRDLHQEDLAVPPGMGREDGPIAEEAIGQAL